MGPTFALITMGLVSFFSYLTVGMLVPFLPQHLASISSSERWSGIIFAFYPIAVITTTPMANALVARFGRPPLIFFGLLVQAVSAFVFGVFGDHLWILLLTRFTQGCGAGASNLAMFALVADMYEETIGAVMGINELCIGAGFTAGPLFGAVLFEYGGFPLPFTVCGALLVLIALLIPVLQRISVNTSHFVAGAEKEVPVDEDGGSSAISRIWAVCTARLLAPAGLMLMGTAVWGIIDSGFYTVHAVHDLGMRQTVIGVNLAAASAAYAGVGPLAGSIADRIGYGLTMYFGALLTAFSLVLLGPAGEPCAEAIAGGLNTKSLVHVQAWWECLVLVVLGCGEAAMLIPSLGAMKSSVPCGDASATEACISIFNTFQQAGLVFGSLASSALGAHYELGNILVALIIVGFTFINGKTLIKCGRVTGAPLIGFTSPSKVMVGAPTEFLSPGLMHQRSTSRSRSFNE